jgi:hypothetical protein
VIARFAAVVVGLTLPVLVAGPAFALHRDDGEHAGPPLGTGLTILYYVVVPVGAFLVISGLALLPSALNRPRYRPGRPWEHAAASFGAPTEEIETAKPTTGSTARGGASAEW